MQIFAFNCHPKVFILCNFLRLIAEICFLPFCESVSVCAIAGLHANSLPQCMKDVKIARPAPLYAWLILSLPYVGVYYTSMRLARGLSLALERDLGVQ